MVEGKADDCCPLILIYKLRNGSKSAQQDTKRPVLSPERPTRAASISSSGLDGWSNRFEHQERRRTLTAASNGNQRLRYK